MIDNVYGFTVEKADGNTESLDQYRGKVLLIVNTASRCGFTPQYEGLEKLYQQYGDRGFVVLGFPCNQFQGQEPGTNEEIQQFCKVNYGVSFPVFAKIDVNGDNAHPLFVFLKDKQRGLLGSKAVKWNFTKFLVDSEGRPVERFAPSKSPDALAEHIEKLLPKR